MSDNPQPLNQEPERDLYRELASADPAARVSHILRLLAEHPRGLLILPTLEGRRATLDGIDLSREQLLNDTRVPKTSLWWNAERQALGLRRADLRGASLRAARLVGAFLEEADLAGADLAGADMHGVDLSGANLTGTLLEGCDLRKGVLRFVRGERSVMEFAKLQDADLWGAQLAQADLSDADLRGAILEEANLEGADLAGVDFRGAVLKRANLKGANLRGADLRGALLGAANLDGAILRDAHIEEVDLSGCSLANIHTCGTRLERTHFEQEQLGEAIGEEISGEYGLARKGYLALERNFDELGDHTAARWAYQRRRRMEKRESLRRAHAAWTHRHWGIASHSLVKFGSDQIVEWVCNYGESVWRVLGTLLFVFIVFVPAYALTDAVVKVEETPAGKTKTPTHEAADLALFSLTAMTSPGNPPDYLVPRNEVAYLLAGIQTVLSIFLTGLMGFVAGNRIRR